MVVTALVDYLLDMCPEEGFPDTLGDKRISQHTEGVLGEIIAGLMKDRFRKYHDVLMVFTGRRYEKMDQKAMWQMVYGFMSRKGVAPCYLSRSVKKICEMVMMNPLLQDFRPRRNVVYMDNCVLVIRDDGSVSQEPFSPDHMSNISLGFPYVPGADCPRWERFLETVLDDGNARAVLQEFLGCMFISKDTLSIEKAMFLYGPGSNGKSVVYETLDAMLGDNITNIGLDQMNGNSGEYYMERCVGKLLAYNSDAAAKDISSGVYKQLISKERIAVRQIRESPFESDDWPMFMANINKSIITTDSSSGFWRRNIVIGFFKVFSDNPDPRLGQLKADKSFKGSMRGEFPGIFNWIMEGRARIIRNGGVFTRSTSIDELVADMRNFSNSVYAYLSAKNYVATAPDSGVSFLRREFSKDMYRDYCEWCLENGYSEKKNISRFREDVMNANIMWLRCLKKDGRVSSGFLFYEIQPRYEEERDAGEFYEYGDDLPM